MADEKKKKLSGREPRPGSATVFGGDTYTAGIVKGEGALRSDRKAKAEEALRKKQREEQPTPDGAMPSLLISLQQKLRQADDLNAKLSVDNESALRRCGELMRQLEMERGNVQQRERGMAFEYWEQPAVCLVRNSRAAELTGLESTLFRNHADMAEVVGNIGQVRDPQGRVMPVEDLPVTRAFRGETVEGMLIYVNGVLIDGRAVPVFETDSGKVDCWILYDEVVK
jgi:hypothetical protein